MVDIIIIIIGSIFISWLIFGPIKYIEGIDKNKLKMDYDERTWYRFGFSQISKYLCELDRGKNGDMVPIGIQKYNHFLLVDKCGEVGIILWTFKVNKNRTKTEIISKELVEHYKYWDDFKLKVLTTLDKNFKKPEDIKT